MGFRDDYQSRVRARQGGFVVAPELHAQDLTLLGRALAAYEDQIDAEMLSAPSDADFEHLRYEKRDAKELGTWLANAGTELWRYNDATAWTQCAKCGKLNIPIGEMGAPELCDDCENE